MINRFKATFIFLPIICLSLLLFSGCEKIVETDISTQEESIDEKAPEQEESEVEEADDPFDNGSSSIEGILQDGEIKDNEYAGNISDSTTGIGLFFSADEEHLYIGIRSIASGWTSVGFDPEFAMKDADIIFMAIDGGQLLMRDDYGTGSFTHSPDEDLGGSSDISGSAGNTIDGKAIFEFFIPLDSGDEFDKVLAPGNSYKIIFALNSNNVDFDSKHTSRSSGELQLK